MQHFKLEESPEGYTQSVTGYNARLFLPHVACSYDWNVWNGEANDLRRYQASSSLFGSINYEARRRSRFIEPPPDACSSIGVKSKRGRKMLLRSGLYFTPSHASDKFTFQLPYNKLVFDRKDFVIPFNTFCPSNKELKLDSLWKLMRRNHWAEGTEAVLKDTTLVTGQCICTSKCDEQCLNRAQLYECDPSCCPMGKADCGNRAIQQLSKDLSEQKRYSKGYEVFLTENKGYGLKVIRGYEPGDLIVEYTGDVIDADEVQHRLKTLYSASNHFYFLSLEKGLVIDSGTRGSLARFVNHSCDPNSIMQKWCVGKKPRMGLFALKKIEAGQELTYDYNFRWFAEKSAQKCYCGSSSCRGTIGERTERTQSNTIKSSNESSMRPLESNSDYSGSNTPPEIMSSSSDLNRGMRTDFSYVAVRQSLNESLEFSYGPSMISSCYSQQHNQASPRQFEYVSRRWMSSATTNVPGNFHSRNLKQSHRALPRITKARSALASRRGSSYSGQSKTKCRHLKPTSRGGVDYLAHPKRQLRISVADRRLLSFAVQNNLF